jgi:hypothetical protein
MGNLTTVTYKVRQLKQTPQVGEYSDVVNNVMWSVVGTDGNNTVVLDGSSPLTLNEGGSFTDLSSLTESQVLGWVTDALKEQGQALMRTNLQKELDKLDGVVDTDPMPWD